ncbi:hypothetical protein Aperf_G00000091033 [Anoplocephala perfoliata]
MKTCTAHKHNSGDLDSGLRLDDIWTSGYYGDEDKLDNVDDEGKWIVFSREDGTLVLKKGLNGETYPITDQYEVSIEKTKCKGHLLSELMRDVVEKTGIGEARRRMGATLIYEKDLLKFIEFKKISPTPEDKEIKFINKGKFDNVVLGKIYDKASNKIREVAIKRIKEKSKYALTGGMELAVMTSLSGDEKSPFILSLVGWYRDLENLCVVTEYMPNGSLYDHLKSVFLNKEDNDHKERILMHRFVCQIASGMRVMEKNKLIHGDLATRNILLNENYNVKISDFGLSRPSESEYSSGVFAIRWAAPEVLEDGSKFTSKADVWSFGVLVWEIYSFGSLPYSDIPTNKLKGFLRKGKRLDKPIGTPNKMSELMENCWKYEAKERSSFEDIVEHLNGKVALTPPTPPPPPPPPPQSLKPTNHRHSFYPRDLDSGLELDDIWTSGYYGDEDKLDNVDDEGKWIVFSREDGTLVLKKGLNGETYPITNQYEVSIEKTKCKGHLLSELMRDVVEKTGIEEARRRMGTTLIYEKDLLEFIEFKKISPTPEDKEIKFINKGKFGNVVLGKIYDKASKKIREVAIKRIKEKSKYALTGGMELAVMTSLSGDEKSPFILSLVGWYRDLENLCVVTEYMPNGSLYDHLKSVFLNKEDNDHKERILMHRFVCQIASGMRVMEKNKLIHGDLATRNILLNENYDIKISDFGLSRPSESEYSSGVFAIRWAAPEVLEDGSKFTSKADVWSFGVLVWEIYSFGSLPYSDTPTNKLKGFLRKGKRLDKPIGTPNKMSELMENCWKYEAKERSSFEDIVEHLNGKVALTPPTPPPPPPPPPQSLKPTNHRHSFYPSSNSGSGSVCEVSVSQGIEYEFITVIK